MERLSHELGKDVGGISEGALKLLMDYNWPGNVRELENAVERAMVTCRGRALTEEDFAFLARSGAPPGPGDPGRDDDAGDWEKLLIVATMQRTGGNIKESRLDPGHRPLHAVREDQNATRSRDSARPPGRYWTTESPAFGADPSTIWCTVSTHPRAAVRKRIYIVVVPILTAFCALGSDPFLARALTRREQVQLQQRTDAEAAHVSEQLRGARAEIFRGAAAIAGRVVALPKAVPPRPRIWRSDAQLFLKSDAALRQVLWVNGAGKNQPGASAPAPQLAGFPLPADPSGNHPARRSGRRDEKRRHLPNLPSRDASDLYVEDPIRRGEPNGIRGCQL